MTDLLRRETALITAGIDLLADAAQAQAVPVTRVDWRPPMDGTSADLARVMGDPRRIAANAEAVRRMVDTQALLVDVMPAADALGLSRDDILHAGPPITWQRASGLMRGALMGAAAYEGLVADFERVVAFYEVGVVNLMLCHDHGTIEPITKIVSSNI